MNAIHGAAARLRALLGIHAISSRCARTKLVSCIGLAAACHNAAPADMSDVSTTTDKPAASAPARSTERSMSQPSAAVSGSAGGPATPSKPATMAMTKSASRSAQPPAADTNARSAQMSNDTDAGAATSSEPLPDLCSGCAGETRDTSDMTVHLHHVHLNVKNREQSAHFYEKYFHAERVLLNGTTEALHVTPTLLLLDEQPRAPDSNLPTALQHMGWGAADTGAWYAQAHAQGIEPDTRGFTMFNTNETPTVGEAGSGAIIALSGDVPACFPIPDTASYMYVLGPDRERIEVWSGADGRVNHMHFTTADLAATSGWYQKFLGLPSMTPLLSYQFFLDDILFFFEPVGAAADYKNTDDHALGHVALAVTDLDVWRKRVEEQGIDVVSEPAAADGFTSFFVRGPEGLLIELVQAAKNTELCPH